MLKHIGLFEGIGGFSLAARWVGWETIAWCEWNEYCQKVLSYHFPEAKQHGNIQETDFTIYRGQCDIVTGGFPCQPYSAAGKRLGKEDDRHLWPEMLRAIREIQPGYVVGENVSGLTNWNGGVVFDEVQADLENEGYEVLPFLLPACAVNAPHRRDRIWFVAYSNAAWKWRNEWEKEIETNVIPDPSSQGLQVTSCRKQRKVSGQAGTQPGGEFSRAFTEIAGWANFPTQSPICSRDDGIPGGLDGIAFSKWRNESIKSLGNAIVPQVAYQIFKAIASLKVSLPYGQEKYERNSSKTSA